MADTIADHIHDINSGNDDVGNLVFKEDGSVAYVPSGESIPVGSTAVVTDLSKTGYAAEGGVPSSFPSLEDMYAAGGAFERSLLRGKSVFVVGVGSVGSAVADCLVREGLGRLVVMDMDRVELHNLSRLYVAGVPDVGRFKVDVMEEYVRHRNPYAEVVKYPLDAREHRDLLAEEMRKADLVICATDGNESRYVINTVAVEMGKTVIYPRAETRAEGLNLFIQRPGGACYNCFIGQGGHIEEEITNEASARANGTIPSYTSAEDAGVMVQIGLPCDIAPLVTMTVKLALVELARGMEGTGIETVSEELAPFNLFIWVNHRDRKYAKFPPFSEPGHGPRILRWYGCLVPPKKHCCTCGEEEPFEPFNG